MTAPIDEPATIEEQICSDVIQQGLAAFDATLGKYLSGEIPFYRGQASGADNAEEIGLPPGSMSGVALAILYPLNSEPGWQLDVYVPAQSAHMSVRQRDARTEVFTLGQVIDRWSSGGLEAEAFAEGVLLASVPQSVELALSVTGEWGDGAPFSATLDATLQIADASLVTPLEAFELVADRSLLDFVERDGELVRTIHDTWRSVADSPPGHDFLRCERIAQYSLEQWVNVRTIEDYGVRDVVLGASEVCCTNLPCSTTDFEGGCPPLDQCFDE